MTTLDCANTADTATAGGSCRPAMSGELVTEEIRYSGLMAYIISNAIAGEIMAVENYSEMVPLMPDTESKIRTCQQAFDETKHIRQLAKLGERVGFPTKQAIVEPQWHNIRRAFREAVHANDLVACLLMQDLMTETLAIVLYSTLTQGTDEATQKTAANILRDEYEHLDLGIARIKALLAQDAEKVHDRLVWAHNKAIPELFSMISYSCHSLCGELNVDCGILGLDSIKTDLDQIHEQAVNTYASTLERCEFRPDVVLSLLANIP